MRIKEMKQHARVQLIRKPVNEDLNGSVVGDKFVVLENKKYHVEMRRERDKRIAVVLGDDGASHFRILQ